MVHQLTWFKDIAGISMSIYKELYDVFDKERNLKKASDAHLRQLQFEIESNIHYMASAFKQRLPSDVIVAGLENCVFKQLMQQSYTINAKPLKSSTINGYKEFEKYLHWHADKLIERAYLRLHLLKKLIAAGQHDQQLKLKSLFRFFMLVHYHLADKALPRRQ